MLTKTFHEVSPYVPLEEPVETVCDDVGVDLPEQANRDAAGCSAMGAGASPWGLFFVLGILRLRGWGRSP